MPPSAAPPMLSRFVAGLRSLWRSLRGYSALDAETSDEFRHHLDLRARDLIAAGVPSAEAHRRARLEFGSVERYKDEGRQSRGLSRTDTLRVSWLDFKLGFRMLVKYPGLTVVGGLAMAFAIWAGALGFEVVTQLVRPTLPLPEGDRIVGIRTWDAENSSAEERVLHDFAAWRSEVKTISDVGAFRVAERNLIIGDGVGEPLEVIEISPSAFRVTRVSPLLGRTLIDADAMPGAPPVVVIGHELWQQRFGSDPNVVGRTVHIGRSLHTVVGVMPATYEFPLNNGLWTPFRADPSGVAPRRGPSIKVFGRLAPGASYDDANAEIAAIGRRMARDFPGTHEHLRAEVIPHARSMMGMSATSARLLAALNIPALMLLVLVCGNVALLMFARAASREGEMIVRTALGATRARIIMQLFAEALVLGTVAAVIGLAAAGQGLALLMKLAEMNLGDLPFWLSTSLSRSTVLYAAILTLLGAVIAGVVPALKVTRGMGSRLQQRSAGSGMRFGGIWTAVIVAQIAVTVAFPAVTFFIRGDVAELRELDPGIRAQEYLGTRLELDREPPPGVAQDTSESGWFARYRAAYEELDRRLASSGTVAGVTFAASLPLMSHDARLIEVDDGGAAPPRPEFPDGYRISSTMVAPNFFEVMEAPIRAGRSFRAGDLEANAMTVVVNQSLVRQVFGDRNPVGRRIRYISEEQSMATIPAAERGPWYEIVGVVPDMGTAAPTDTKSSGIYHPARIEDIYPAQVAVHVRGDAESFMPKLRAIAGEIDPSMRLYDIKVLSTTKAPDIAALRFVVRLLLGVSLVALVLSLAGIYAVMSFTVARRTREIGIRVALGAGRRRVIAAIFRLPLIQMTVGVVAGYVLLCTLSSVGEPGPIQWKMFASFVPYAVFMFGVCLLACIVPTLRALGVQPTEALRTEV